MSDQDQELARKVDTLIRLVALGLIEGKRQSEQIRVLAAAGIKPIQIAEILSTTPNTVNVTLSSLRKDGKLTSRRKPTNDKQRS